MKNKILQSVGKTPNKLTKKTIDDARQNKGLSKPISNVKEFMKSINA